jgi:hypothetical protein
LTSGGRDSQRSRISATSVESLGKSWEVILALAPLAGRIPRWDCELRLTELGVATRW